MSSTDCPGLRMRDCSVGRHVHHTLLRSMSTELRLVCGKKPDDPDLEEAEDIKVRVEVTLHDECSSYMGSHLVINKSRQAL